jgi:WD40 repeat protein
MAAEQSSFPLPATVLPGPPGPGRTAPRGATAPRGRPCRGARRWLRRASAAHGPASWQVLVDDVPAALAAGGGLVAAGGPTGAAWVLEAASGRLTATLSLPGGVLDLAFSPDGRHLLLTGPRGYALWHADDGRATLLASGRCSARALWAEPGRAAVADGRVAVVLDAFGRQLWRTAQLPRTLTGLGWLPGGGLAVACDSEVRWHEPGKAVPAASFTLPGDCPVITVPANGRWICASGHDGSVHVRRTSDAAEFTLSSGPAAKSRLAFDGTGSWLAAGISSHVNVWDFTGEEPPGRAPWILRAHDEVTALAWRPGRGTVLATAGSEGTVALWNATAGKPGRPRTTTAGWSLDDSITALAWNGPGTLLAATRDGTLHALDPARPCPPGTARR